MSNRVPETTTAGNPWRYRCPDGHSYIRMGRTTFRCRSCKQSYPKSELVDLAEK